MSRSTISLLQLFQMFPDSETARGYMEARRWPNGTVCPACAEQKRIYERTSGAKRCNACMTTFSVRTGAIFEESNLPLNKWLYAMYLLVTARKGISSVQLHAEIGVTQKTAWFMLQRLREACGNDPMKLAGIVEIDETYIGGKEGAKHETAKLKRGRGTVGKTPVIGMREKGGRVKERVDRMTKLPATLNEITDVILAYRPAKTGDNAAAVARKMARKSIKATCPRCGAKRDFLCSPNCLNAL